MGFSDHAVPSAGRASAYTSPYGSSVVSSCHDRSANSWPATARGAEHRATNSTTQTTAIHNVHQVEKLPGVDVDVEYTMTEDDGANNVIRGTTVDACGTGQAVSGLVPTVQ